MKKIGVYFLLSLFIIIMLFLLLQESSKKNKDVDNILEIKAKVLKVDNRNLVQSGITQLGSQILNIKILDGKYKGKKINAVNNLLGDKEIDNIYEKGNIIIVTLMEKNGEIVDAKANDMYRQGWEIVLFLIFIMCLLLYAKMIGLKAIFSFIASLYILWCFLIPNLLNGKEPIVYATITIILLSAIIIFSIAGITKKGISAFIGTIAGEILTIVITIFFGEKLKLYGMTSPHASTLLFSGHLDLNIRHIFYGAIMLGASGAAMDIAMDVAASMEEIKLKKPNITTKELIQSGFNVGRAVIGTMSTTLLLAYSGGYLTLLMLFKTKNVNLIRIINMKIVSAEIMRTLVGSIGLVLVAPLTAIVAGIIYTNVKLIKLD